MTLVKLVDSSRCQGCKACQVACKQWNQLPAEQNYAHGTYQNPPDLSCRNWNVVKFHENRDSAGQLRWTFFHDSCRHCPSPFCKMACPVSDAITKDKENGAVRIDPTKCGNCCMECKIACPFGVPKFASNPSSNTPYRRAFKCTLCFDRISNADRKDGATLGLATADRIPSCAKTCPPGAISFGEQSKMVALAKSRVEKLKNRFPEANLYPGEDYGVIWILTDSPGMLKLACGNSVEKKEKRTAMAKLWGPLGWGALLGGALIGLVRFREKRG